MFAHPVQVAPGLGEARRLGYLSQNLPPQRRRDPKSGFLFQRVEDTRQRFQSALAGGPEENAECPGDLKPRFRGRRRPSRSSSRIRSAPLSSARAMACDSPLSRSFHSVRTRPCPRDLRPRATCFLRLAEAPRSPNGPLRDEILRRPPGGQRRA